jgi:hypothetical protein
MEATDLSTFHHWLLVGGEAGTPSIVIGSQQEIPASLGTAVARHLNEYDEDAHGNWLSFSPELVERIAESGTQRSLLGIVAGCQCAATATGGCEAECSHRHEVLATLAAQGRAVLPGTAAMQACTGAPNVFCVWLGYPPERAEAIHLILHPEHFNGHALPAIIGDTFLEWANARLAHAAR